jgi:hypothetical protein|uniref:PsbP C-terminal domain-containing protein n=1 Tax=Phaeodactylum tricornutum TaxID=2850 RepID=A0A8J9X9D9_PHATR
MTFRYAAQLLAIAVLGLSVCSYALSLRSPPLDRRAWLATCASAAAVGFPSTAVAVSVPTLTPFLDSRHGFTVDVPSQWSRTEQQLSDRRTIVVWTDPADARASVFVAYTPVRDDFTSLGSFGSVDQVAAQTILPKAQIAGVDVEATMLAAVSQKQAYFFDYRQAVPNVQPPTHFRTIFTLQQGATGGAGAVLVTLTAQCPEELYATKYQSLFDSILDSYAKSK